MFYVVIGVCLAVVAALWQCACLKRIGRRAGPRVTISKETTYLVAPLRDDGYVDYRAAVNEMQSEGVTPENNFVVVLWQAVGPKIIDPEYRATYFRQLGIHPLAETGDYLLPIDGFVKAPTNPEEQLDSAGSRPWLKRDFPEVAAWLDANEKPLRLIVEGSRRPRCYSPLYGPEAGAPIMNSLLPAAQEARPVARSIAARAMLKLESGQLDDAFDDSLACRHIGRLMGQGTTLIESLVAFSIDEMADRIDLAIAASGKMTAKQARRYADELRRLPALPNVVDDLNLSERFFLLDAVAALAKGKKLTLGRDFDEGEASDAVECRLGFRTPICEHLVRSPCRDGRKANKRGTSPSCSRVRG